MALARKHGFPFWLAQVLLQLGFGHCPGSSMTAVVASLHREHPVFRGRIRRELKSFPAQQRYQNSVLFQPCPYQYKNITILTYTCETDGEAALELLPAPLELPDGPVIAKMIFANFAFSSLGFYNEVAQAINCYYRQSDGTVMLQEPKKGGTPKPKQFVYPTQFHVTSDRAMAAGRESPGIPRKIGSIIFHTGTEYLAKLESPNGLEICSAVLVPNRRIRESDLPGS